MEDMKSLVNELCENEQFKEAIKDKITCYLTDIMRSEEYTKYFNEHFTPESHGITDDDRIEAYGCGFNDACNAINILTEIIKNKKVSTN